MGPRYSPAVCSAQRRVYTNIPSHGTRIPVRQAAVIENRTGCAREAPGRGIYMEPLVDGPAGSPILIHSITADNDRLNGPPSLDELCCASTPGILLRPRTSPSNLIQGGLGRVGCRGRLQLLFLSLLSVLFDEKRREERERKKRELPYHFLRYSAR